MQNPLNSQEKFLRTLSSSKSPLSKIAILTIGNEITSGQIVNSNSSWLAQRIQALGLNTPLHISVPDDRELISAAYGFCWNQGCNLIITTGGLGPTSDDFTRETISVESHCPLQWDEISWQKIVDRLTTRGRVVNEIQKQQCYFPAGARILFNSEGTANGFYLNYQTPSAGSPSVEREFLALPGPPKEIQAIWEDFVDSWLTERSAHIDKRRICSWDIADTPESEIALLLEPVFKGSPFTLGYRLHRPYVEFKIHYHESQRGLLQPYIEKVEIIFASHNKIVKPILR